MLTKKCSFCNKSEDEVKEFIKGQTGYICDSCIVRCSEILNYRKINKHIDNNFLKPHEIVEKLNEYVIGQEKAKKILAVTAYNHYKRINNDTNIKKTNIMLMGPTGSGKTYLIERLSEILDVPFVIGDANTLTIAGYVGDDVESLIYKLYLKAGKDIEKTQKGIIYIDEIDKIAAVGSNMNSNQERDPKGEGVQQALLKMIESKEVELKINNKGFETGTLTIDTTNILFVVGGSFPGLFEKKKEGTKIKKIGFNSEEVKSEESNDEITEEDLLKCGFIGEFIGRIPVRVILEELSLNDLTKILTDSKDSLIKQYENLFKIDDVNLSFTLDAVEYIAKKAMDKKIGARGLRGVIENNMYELMYELPKHKHIKDIEITKEILENNKLMDLLVQNVPIKKRGASY